MYLTAFHSSAWTNKIQIKQNGLYAAIEFNVDVMSNTVNRMDYLNFKKQLAVLVNLDERMILHEYTVG